MNISPLTMTGSLPSDPTSGQGLSDSMTTSELDAVSTQFESVFMSMLVKEMRESTEDGLFPGENSDTYGALFDMYLGQHMAESGGVGIKQMLVSRYAEHVAKGTQGE